ncbi:hypothetical protein AB0912_32465 [Streptomyces sp. NPDC007084]|uniref:hypothetical protein n=1 Tax=Streptomyces sp. NPDC007084 TaxID=3154313 RepID=UPI0034523B80
MEARGGRLATQRQRTAPGALFAPRESGAATGDMEVVMMVRLDENATRGAVAA